MSRREMSQHDSTYQIHSDSVYLEGNDVNILDPLNELDYLGDFIKRLDSNFEQHMKCLGVFHKLLESKATLDQQYAHNLNVLSSQFSDLARIGVNNRIKDIVLALGRNFKNFSNNLESMSYDLLTEASKGFDKCKEETTRELSNIKNFVKGA